MARCGMCKYEESVGDGVVGGYHDYWCRKDNPSFHYKKECSEFRLNWAGPAIGILLLGVLFYIAYITCPV